MSGPSVGARSRIKLGRLMGLSVSADVSALITSLLLWAMLSGAALLLLNRSFPVAITAGLIAVLLHWIGVVWHQLGHAWAARRTGHPMVGMNMWGALSSSLYPTDEEPLPRPIHIQRALGGPLASLVLTVLAAIPLLIFSPDTTAWWLAFFFFLDNLLVFTLGSFLPLGFTDGSTLLQGRKESKGDQ
ncbi:MAG TPA: hypothetical protein VJ183_06590 [Chloroflexia bacterium]|nr:hypothetical protein [Chloroflexia bacterium]